MNSYTKLKDGSWGVRVEGTAQTGQSVQVTTKAGAVKTERVASVLWTGQDKHSGKTMSLCSVLARAHSGGSYAAGTRAPHGRTCPMCGSRDCAKAWDPRDLCDQD